jgi:hypothetical protein
MKCKFLSAVILIMATPVLSISQQTGLSAFSKCELVISSDLSDNQSPTFAAYSAVVPKVSGSRLDLESNPTARMYRTLLRREVALGPNFAGHYRVAVWGCGSSCSMFAVVNLDTGRVITPDGFSSTSLVFFDVDDFLPRTQSDYFGFRFRKNSKLLVVIGALDEDEAREGAFYFVMANEHLRLIHSTIVKKDCENLPQ